ncbi:MAG: hypothetical protein RLZZ511_816 [Cyanobacteriota bacterium]|jgi:hypothetical protein
MGIAQSSKLINPTKNITTAASRPKSGRSVFRITGSACLAGFTLDLIVNILPLQLGELSWRMNMLQQLGDRSILLLLGLALLTISGIGRRPLRRHLGPTCLTIGIAFMLAGTIAIRDTVTLQRQTNQNIATQSIQLQEQIQQAKSNPKAKITSAQIEEAVQQVTQKSATLQKNSQTQILKTGLSSIGNLFITGIGLIGLGRYGMHCR